MRFWLRRPRLFLLFLVAIPLALGLVVEALHTLFDDESFTIFGVFVDDESFTLRGVLATGGLLVAASIIAQVMSDVCGLTLRALRKVRRRA